MLNASHLLQGKDNAIYHISPEDSVYEAIRQMAEKGIGALLVMQDDALTGIVSERDYARNVILKGRSSRGTRVAEIMSQPVITVAPSASLKECMHVVTEERVRHLPVVEAGRVLGVLSIGDLIKAQLDEQARQIEQLQTYIAG